MNGHKQAIKDSRFQFITILAMATLLMTICIVPLEANAYNRHQIKRMIIKESMNSIVPPSLALAVAKVESDFNPNALSSAGARGIMQIMPRTGRHEFGVSADELWDPRLNIQLGIDFLAQLYRQYGNRWDLALSHYNGGTLHGHGRHARPHNYTRSYVKSVLRWQGRYKKQSAVWQVAYKTEPLPDTHTYDMGRRELKATLEESLREYRKLRNNRLSERYRLRDGSSYRGYWAKDNTQQKFTEEFDEDFWKRVKRTRARMNLLQNTPFKERS